MTPRSTARRTAWIVAVATLVAAPAVALRVLCVGPACDRTAPPVARIPFCSLPGEVRQQVAAGYRDGRSPELLAVTGTAVAGAWGLGSQGLDVPWPSARGPAPRIPIVFAGTGIRRGSVPPGTGLDDVAPTVAEVLGLRRPHPEVRSGTAVPGVAVGLAPRLVVEVVWKGVGSTDLERARNAWPLLRSLLRRGAGTLEGDPASAPLDPAALLATLGTGGIPSQHGITGTLLRNDRGALVEAWGPGAPFSVIAALGDDLDRRLGQDPLIGLVGTDGSDRGAIGGNWYLRNDRDDVAVVPGPARLQAEAAERVLGSGYGADGVPDFLVVTMRDGVRAMDRALGRIVAAATRVARGSVAVMVTSTGPVAPADAVSDRRVQRRVERAVGAGVVEATAVGGVFLDQRALARADLPQDEVLVALRSARGPAGDELFADAFTGVAVSLERYC